MALAYVNRSTRLQGDGLALVSEMRAVVDACSTLTEILVASLKSPAEVVQAVIAGAHHVTIPLALMLEMGNHPCRYLTRLRKAGTMPFAVWACSAVGSALQSH